MTTYLRRPSLKKRIHHYLHHGRCLRAKRLLSDAREKIRELEAYVEQLVADRDEAEHAQALLIEACLSHANGCTVWHIGMRGGLIPGAAAEPRQEAINRIRQVAGLDEVGRIRKEIVARIAYQ